MIYEIDASCANCPLQEERDAVVETWNSLEEEVKNSAVAELLAEGLYRCEGPKKWAIGPFVLGYSCQAEIYESKIHIDFPPEEM